MYVLLFTLMSILLPNVNRHRGFKSSLKETAGGAVVFLIIYIYLEGLYGLLVIF